MQRLGDTNQYQEAFSALMELQKTMGTTPQLKAIAQFLLHANPVEVPDEVFPWRKCPDRQVVEAYENYWRQHFGGEDDSELDDDDDFQSLRV